MWQQQQKKEKGKIFLYMARKVILIRVSWINVNIEQTKMLMKKKNEERKYIEKGE